MESENKRDGLARLASRSWLIRKKEWLSCLLTIPLFLVASKAQSQTIGAYQYPQGTQETLYQGSVIDINPADQYNFPMVDLVFYVTNPPSAAASIDWSIDVDYLDQAGYKPYDSVSATQRVGYVWSPSWGGDSAGGTAAVKADFYDCHNNSVGSASFSFSIEGVSQTKTQTDSAYGSSAPWFFPYIIGDESCGTGYQFAPSQLSSCMSSENKTGDPLWGSPDGIGVAQIDMTAHFDDTYYPYISDVYWNYKDNIGEALDVLNGEQESNTCGSPDYEPSACEQYGYDFWDRQVYQMCQYKGGQYSAGSGLGMASCSTVQPISNPPSDLPDCSSFDGAQLTANQPSAYRDAEWITDYNGTGGVSGLYPPGYYIIWDQSSDAWTFNILQSPPPGHYGSYVGDVCNSSSY